MTTRLVFAGFGGQGVILAGKLFCIAAMKHGYFVSHIPSYGAEMRGGTANCSVVVSDQEIPSPVVVSPHIACIFNEPSLKKFGPRLRRGGTLLYNSSLIEEQPSLDAVTILPIHANDLAEAAGSLKAVNMAMLGALAALRPELCTLDELIDSLDQAVSSRNKALNDMNRRALEAGFEAMRTVRVG